MHCGWLARVCGGGCVAEELLVCVAVDVDLLEAGGVAELG